MNLTRKEAGLDWTLHAPPRVETTHVAGGSRPRDYKVLDPKPDAKELNPYLKSGGVIGFPSERENERPTKEGAPLQPHGIGDGGTSWRLKALKRAHEQASREDRKLDEHEGSTRNVDDNVWEEVRNFKKCLVKMFMRQNKDVLFIETVIGPDMQKRHCLVECIPISSDIAKQAPLYFKKAIEEAEDEWSQHNAKKLIDTRGKGLRACIPKNFPYFHVEFGMQGGYCHVIDDEANFNRDLGHDVIKGILQEPEDELHLHVKQQSAEKQRQAVIEFSKMWNPYDWTKVLA